MATDSWQWAGNSGFGPAPRSASEESRAETPQQPNGEPQPPVILVGETQQEQPREPRSPQYPPPELVEDSVPPGPVELPLTQEQGINDAVIPRASQSVDIPQTLEYSSGHRPHPVTRNLTGNVAFEKRKKSIQVTWDTENEMPAAIRNVFRRMMAPEFEPDPDGVNSGPVHQKFVATFDLVETWKVEEEKRGSDSD